MIRTMFAALLLSATAALPAAAADGNTAPATDRADLSAAASATPDAGVLAGDIDWALPAVHVGDPSRGRMLPALYVTFAALQAYDGYSTTVGLAHGARESNGAVAGVAGRPAAFWAMKGGATLLSVYAAERLWKQHRRGQAIAMMVVSNVVMAAVAANNASVLHAQGR
jgi:hypothetical protein